MDPLLMVVALSTPSMVLRYAAAFFFVVVAVALAYALVRAGKALARVDKVLADVDEQGMPLMQKASTTLDEVNASLGNVDDMTRDVADMTDRVERLTAAVEGVVATPMRKVASFGSGVQQAMSSFFGREPQATTPSAGEAAEWPAGEPWSQGAAGTAAGWQAPPSEQPAAEPHAGLGDLSFGVPADALSPDDQDSPGAAADVTAHADADAQASPTGEQPPEETAST